MRLFLSRSPRRLAAGVVLLLLAAGCKKEQKKAPPPDNAPPPITGEETGKPAVGSESSATPGWFEGRDTVGGYKMLLPGRPLFREKAATNIDQEAQASVLSHATEGDPENATTVQAASRLPTGASKLGTTPDELYANFAATRAGFLTFNEVVAKSPVTLGGRPAVKLVVKEKAAPIPLPDDPELVRDELDRRKKKAAKRTTFLLTANKNRIITIQINTPGEPDPTFLNTVIGSFRFL